VKLNIYSFKVIDANVHEKKKTKKQKKKDAEQSKVVEGVSEQ
jgi:hypothetical protein